MPTGTMPLSPQPTALPSNFDPSTVAWDTDPGPQAPPASARMGVIDRSGSPPAPPPDIDPNNVAWDTDPTPQPGKSSPILSAIASNVNPIAAQAAISAAGGPLAAGAYLAGGLASPGAAVAEASPVVRAALGGAAVLAGKYGMPLFGVNQAIEFYHHLRDYAEADSDDDRESAASKIGHHVAHAALEHSSGGEPE